MSRNLRQEIYNYIKGYIGREGVSPSYSEIRYVLQIKSSHLIEYHLKVLEKKGLITLQPNKDRGIRVTGVPVKGTIAAGEPLEIFTEPEQAVDMGHEFVYDNTYALRVKGRSMVDDHICDGDYVIIREQQRCENRDMIVAVRFEQGSMGRATLKRFLYQEGEEYVYLIPANAELGLEPIPILWSEWSREWQIQGKVVAILRQHVTRDKISTALSHYD